MISTNSIKILNVVKRVTFHRTSQVLQQTRNVAASPLRPPCHTKSFSSSCPRQSVSPDDHHSLTAGTSENFSPTDRGPYFQNSLSEQSVGAVVRRYADELQERDVPEALLSVQHIVASVLDCSRASLESKEGQVLSPSQSEDLRRLITCRLERAPVQYIIGDWDFHDITLDVRPPVFIPRPETEQLADDVIRCVKAWPGAGNPRLLELCCGSGAITLAVLRACPGVEATAVDRSAEAVSLTAHNAVKLGVQSRLTVKQCEVTEEPLVCLPLQRYDIIVANPPYVPTAHLRDLAPEIRLYEDLRALDGGPDGLTVIKLILRQAANLLSEEGLLFLEVDERHGRELPLWLQEEQERNQSLRCLQFVSVQKDFSGRDRFIRFRRVLEHNYS